MRMKIVPILLIGIITISGLQAESLGNLFRKPGAMGDSLSHGFYSGGVVPKSQDWAYPVLVSKQAGSSLTYYKMQAPLADFEAVLRFKCGPICLAKGAIGVHTQKPNPASITHAGYTGADYSNALRTSGKCENIEATKQVKDWYWQKRYKKVWIVRIPYWVLTYRWQTVQNCRKPDSRFAQLTLEKLGSQIQVMENVKPSFVFAAVGANHVLCSAIETGIDCLELKGAKGEKRFKADFGKIMDRLSRINTVRGGVVFTVPNVTAVRYLERFDDPLRRPGMSGLMAFWNPFPENPDEVLDPDEIARVETYLEMLNNEIKIRARANNFAVADMKVAFDEIRDNGREIRDPNSGRYVGMAGATWPLEGQPGVFGLDGVHPNRYGHAVMANELIKAINAKYGVSIQEVNEYAAWYHDSLNQKPLRPDILAKVTVGGLRIITSIPRLLLEILF